MSISYTVDSSLTVPYRIGLYRYVSGMALSGSVQNPLGIYSGIPSYGIGWYGSDTLYQVQWCYKRRLTPAESITRGYEGADVWVPWDGDLTTGSEGTAGEEWGAWQGIDIDTTAKTWTTPPAYAGTSGLYAVDSGAATYVPMTLPLPYDLSVYDCAVIQIQARVALTFTSPEKVSNWGVSEIWLAPIPVVSSVSAGLNDDGSVALTVNTNWTRGGNLFTTRVCDDSGAVIATVSEQVDADFVVTIPAGSWSGGDKLYLRSTYITTGDGARTRIPDGEYSVGDPTPVTPVPQPTIDIAEDGTVTVGGTYDKVTLRGTFVDEEGNVYDELVELTQTADGWVGHLGTPPYDVPITATIVAYVGDDWDYWTETLTVPSGGLVTFTWGDESLAIRYNPDRQLSVSFEGDVVNIAGSALPKSRHSMSRTSSMTMTGTLINPAEDAYNGDGWLADVEKLNAPHDWYFRTPNGLRRRVSVESYTPAWATQSANRIMDITVVMQEVSD